MKTITFFSEKGGVGKSTFAILYASWLHYKYGVKVALADYNFRIDAYRRDELRERAKLIARDPSVPAFDETDAWPILTADAASINEIEKRCMGQFNPYVEWFREKTYRYGGMQDMDVVVCDFPGSLTGGEYSGLAMSNFLNLTVIPVERDPMTMKSTELMHDIAERNNLNHCMFLTKVRVELVNLRKPYMLLADRIINRLQWPLLPDMVSYSERIRSLDKVENIRSTFEFADFDGPVWGKSRDLGIENLFIDVTKELDRTADLPKTKAADLSFVYALEKRNDGRGLKGTAFPDYEI